MFRSPGCRHQMLSIGGVCLHDTGSELYFCPSAVVMAIWYCWVRSRVIGVLVYTPVLLVSAREKEAPLEPRMVTWAWSSGEAIVVVSLRFSVRSSLKLVTELLPVLMNPSTTR